MGMKEALETMPRTADELRKALERGDDYYILPNDQLVGFHETEGLFLVWDKGNWRPPQETDGLEGLNEAGGVTNEEGIKWVAETYFNPKD